MLKTDLEQHRQSSASEIANDHFAQKSALKNMLLYAQLVSYYEVENTPYSWVNTLFNVTFYYFELSSSRSSSIQVFIAFHERSRSSFTNSSFKLLFLKREALKSWCAENALISACCSLGCFNE